MSERAPSASAAINSLRADLAAGRGRAWVAVRRGHASGVEREIDRVCLQACGYDPQCEGSRIEWLYEIAGMTQRLAAIRPRVLSSLLRSKARAHSWTLLQRLDFAALDAARGQRDSRDAVLAFFARNSRAYAGHANDALLRAAGGEGFAFALRTLSAAGLLDRHEFAMLVDAAIERLGSSCANTLLSKLDGELPVLRLRREEYSNRQRRRTRQRRVALRWSSRELELIISGARPMSSFALSRWGQSAPMRMVDELDRRIVSELDTQTLERLFSTFRKRAMVHGIDRALDLANRGASTVTIRALEALAATRDNRARTIAIRRVKTGSSLLLASSITVLTAQRRAGDEQVLAERLARLNSTREIHSIGHSLLDWCRSARTGARASMLVWIWDHTPCSLCRESALRLLSRHVPHPQRILRDARHDASPAVRALASAIAARQMRK